MAGDMSNMLAILLRLRQHSVHPKLPYQHSNKEQAMVKETLKEQQRKRLLDRFSSVKVDSVCPKCKASLIA
jgi:hypothetical protein